MLRRARPIVFGVCALLFYLYCNSSAFANEASLSRLEDIGCTYPSGFNHRLVRRFKWGELDRFADERKRLAPTICLRHGDQHLGLEIRNDADVASFDHFAIAYSIKVGKFFIATRSGLWQSQPISLSSPRVFDGSGEEKGRFVSIDTDVNHIIIAACRLRDRIKSPVLIVDNHIDDSTGNECGFSLKVLNRPPNQKLNFIDFIDFCTIPLLRGDSCKIIGSGSVISNYFEKIAKRPILYVPGGPISSLGTSLSEITDDLGRDRRIDVLAYTGGLARPADPDTSKRLASGEVLKAYKGLKDETGRRPIVVAASFGTLLLEDLIANEDSVDLVLLVPVLDPTHSDRDDLRSRWIANGMIELEETDEYVRKYREGALTLACRAQSHVRLVIKYSSRDEVVGNAGPFIRKTIRQGCHPNTLDLIRTKDKHSELRAGPEVAKILKRWDGLTP